jgi:hypothetical protein
MSNSVARPLHHIGYWVDDVEEAAWRAHRDLGIGPFALAAHISFTGFVLDGRPVDEPIVFDHSAAFAAWGSIVLELGQVHEIDDGLAAAYGVRTGTVSHVSWLAPDLAAERVRLADAGCTFINSAETGPVSVEWLTGGRLFAHPIEVHRDSEFMRGMHDRLVRRAQEWDGTGIFVPMG